MKVSLFTRAAARLGAVCAGMLLGAQTLAMPIDLKANFFIEDGTVVSFGPDCVEPVNTDCTSLTIAESDNPGFGSFFVINDPFFNDPQLFDPAETEPVFLDFEYEFLLGAGNDDVFLLSLFDADDFFNEVVIDLVDTTGLISATTINLTQVAADLGIDLATKLGIAWIFDDLSGSGTDSEFTIANVVIGPAAVTNPPSTTVSAPGTVFLMLMGLLGLAWRRCRAG